MIPKIIHYCWFGHGRLPRMARKCIKSWKKKMPDYKIMVWNELNFDVHCCKYVEEAYVAKKYAFVSDYARLSALDKFGGVYLDTDVEVLKSLDQFLQCPAFVGFESTEKVGSGIIGSEPHGCLVREWLEDYKNRRFVLPDGNFDITPNVDALTRLLHQHGAVLDGKEELVNGYALVYPKTHFCAKDWKTGEYYITQDTYAVHHFAASWVPSRDRCIWWTESHIGFRAAYYVGYFWRPPRVVIANLLAALKRRLGL